MTATSFEWVGCMLESMSLVLSSHSFIGYIDGSLHGVDYELSFSLTNTAPPSVPDPERPPSDVESTLALL
ncbi:hypothetical protein CDL12_10815 [Handroanthus impetiginosus]|uniref:Uncharacterized protein n=1 Tax=Handroanthus impetiginosus TaxID=429701 RepID=A0A2G9HGH6_9LAMI|nr:hypothetical protein CDL12_10815 [Handroanthus impetiginosus]